jgi:hypothetical protein
MIQTNHKVEQNSIFFKYYQYIFGKDEEEMGVHHFFVFNSSLVRFSISQIVLGKE